MTKRKNAALTAAQRRNKSGTDFTKPVRLSTGYFAFIRPVSAAIISEAQSVIPDAVVPMWTNEAKGTEEPNPDHPDYPGMVAKVEQERTIAGIDAMILFGVEIVNDATGETPYELSMESRWFKKLQLRERHGLTAVKLEDFDLEDELELEFLFKKYVAVAAKDVEIIAEASGGLTEEEIAAATRSFQDNT